MMKTQEDFENLVLETWREGDSRFTFALDHRVTLAYDRRLDKQWLLIVTPMPTERGKAIGETDRWGTTWEIGAKTVLHLTEGNIQGLEVVGVPQFPFRDGAFEEADIEGMKHPDVELQFAWWWKQDDLVLPVTPNRNDLCYCGSGKKFKKCCRLKAPHLRIVKDE